LGVTKSIAGMTLEQLTYFDRPVLRVLSRLFLAGESGTAQEFAVLTKLSRDNVHHGIRDMRKNGLIRIRGWQPPEGKRTSWLAVYEAGGEPDVGKPKPKSQQSYEVRKEQRDRKAEVDKELEAKRAVTKEVADILKPRLTPDQAYQVNRNYWNWISGGAYG
jgi:DNA-binding transcriptional regulator GbsR (MarR family)